MQDFIEQILKNLDANGYPEKTVTFPTEKMYEVADKKSLSLNTIMDEMRDKHHMSIDVGTDKISFSSAHEPSSMADEDMMAKAKKMMEQMDPAELERMKDMFMNMSDTEKEELMKKGKNMGII